MLLWNLTCALRRSTDGLSSALPRLSTVRQEAAKRIQDGSAEDNFIAERVPVCAFGSRCWLRIMFRSFKTPNLAFVWDCEDDVAVYHAVGERL
jgi:hypothetical protein